jgi:hypothetical protein
VTETQIRNKSPIPFHVCSLQVFEEPAAAAHHLQEAAAAMMILFVIIEVAPKIIDSGRQEGNLDRCAATILFVELVLLDCFFAIDRHLVRASAGVYAAGEAPPRIVLINVSACKAIKRSYPPQPHFCRGS